MADECSKTRRNLFSRIFHSVSSLKRGTSSNVEELEGRLLALVRCLPICGQTPWKLREVERLLLKGAPVSARSLFENFTALHCACQNDDIPTARLLIQYGIDVNAKACDGSTPLHSAAAFGHSCDMVKLLHENGADPNATNDQGETALHLAAMLPHPLIARTLISLGANAFLCASAQTGVQLALSRPLGHSLRSGRLELILLFLQQGDSFDDFDSRFVLSYGYKRCINLEIVKLLVDAGLRIPRVLFEDDERERFKNWPDSFMEWLNSPRSLRMQCMRIIRQSVGRNNLRRISHLHLPVKLKAQLMYQSEGIGLKDSSHGCDDKNNIKLNKRIVTFNIYEHAAPCRCI